MVIEKSKHLGPVYIHFRVDTKSKAYPVFGFNVKEDWVHTYFFFDGLGLSLSIEKWNTVESYTTCLRKT